MIQPKIQAPGLELPGGHPDADLDQADNHGEQPDPEHAGA
jgi:hypothetical protein